MSASPGSRRELAWAALLCLAGAGLAVFAGGQAWASVHAVDSVVTARSVTGTELSGAATALGWAGLAGVAALFAVGGRARSGLGALLALLGAGLVYLAATATGHEHVVTVAAAKSQSILMAGPVSVDTTGWPIVSVAGGVLLLAAGLLTAVRGARWPGMSSRYTRSPSVPETGNAPEAGKPKARSEPAAMWKALDRGEDPTGE